MDNLAMIEELVQEMQRLRRVQLSVLRASGKDFEARCRLNEATGYIEVLSMRLQDLK